MNTRNSARLFSQLAVYLLVFRPDSQKQFCKLRTIPVQKCSSEHNLHSAVLDLANLLGAYVI